VNELNPRAGGRSQSAEVALSRPVIGYLVLALVISWAALLTRQSAGWSPGIDQTLRMLAKYGPSLAGLIMAAVVARRSGVLDLLRRLIPYPLSISWTLFALLAPPAILLVALPIRAAFGGQVPESPNLGVGSVGGFFSFLAARFFAGGGLGEELGWRGFMLPRVQAVAGALRASLIVGLCHGAWHLPAYGLFGTIVITLFTVSGAVVFTWMYNATNGSVFLAALLHASSNASLQFFERVFPALDNDALFVLLSVLIWGLLAVGLVRRGAVR
jgi:membrane protease YdiL (CAAX protease family)